MHFSALNAKPKRFRYGVTTKLSANSRRRPSSLLLLLTVLLLSATTGGQLVTLHVKNAPLKEVFDKIRKQTELVFFVNEDVLVNTRPVTINVKKRELTIVLDSCLNNQGLSYTIVGTTVVIKVSTTPRTPEPSQLLKVSSIDVSGKILDEKGEAIVASVMVKGTKRGTTSDANGYFGISEVDEKAVLVISAANIETQDVRVNGRSVINITVRRKIEVEESVTVSTGYWTVEKRKNVGNITKVDAKDIERQPVTSPLLALQGRVPGLEITPISGVPGSAVNVKVRGQNSLRFYNKVGSEGSQPLFVIDGIFLDPTPISTANFSINSRGFDPLGGLNPANIESIEVLKDADATAIYGSRGANGVILITTKNRKVTGGTNIDVSTYSGVGQIVKRIEMVTKDQFFELYHEAIRNDSIEDLVNDPFYGPGFFASLRLWDTTRYTDWQKTLMDQTSDISDVQFNLRTGNENTSFGIGGAYHKETMMVPGDFAMKRYNVTASGTHTSVNRRFNASFRLNYGVSDHSLFNSSDFLLNVMSMAPNAPKLLNDDGTLNWEVFPDNVIFGGTESWANPLSYLKITNDALGRTLTASTILSYELLPKLQLRIGAGYQRTDHSEVALRPISSYSPTDPWLASTGGTRTENFSNRTSWNIDPQLSYIKKLGDHDINAVFGATIQDMQDQTVQFIGRQFSSDALLGTLAGAKTITSFSVNNQYRYLSLLSRIGYSYKDRYLLSISGRRDGSSKFGPDSRYGNFGAIAGGWIFSSEPFFENVQPVISFGKITASFGSSGNDQINNSNYLKRYTISSSNYNGVIGLVPISLFNPDFRWEFTRKLELAMELGLLNDRITTRISWYRNRSSNQLVDFPLSFVTGFDAVKANYGALVQNTGVEVTLNTKNIDNSHFKWQSNFILSIPRNKLVAFEGIENTAYYDMYKVGAPLSVFRGYVYKGVNPQTGLYEFADNNGDGQITYQDWDFNKGMDLIYHGGITNSISWNGFDLSFLFQYSNRYAHANILSSSQMTGTNVPTKVLDRWQKPGDVTNIQRLSTGRDQDANNALNQFFQSSGYLERISFWRLKTLTLNYRFPQSLTAKVKLKSLDVFIQGQNLATITSYDGWDPETLYSLPPVQIISFGLNLKF